MNISTPRLDTATSRVEFCRRGWPRLRLGHAVGWACGSTVGVACYNALQAAAVLWPPERDAAGGASR